MKKLKLVTFLFFLFTLTNCSKDKEISETITPPDIYYCGKSGNFPTYWKNELQFNLETDGYYGTTSSITKSGNDIYTCGVITNPSNNTKSLVVWKNQNIISTLGQNINGTYPNSEILVSNNDIYVTNWSYNSIPVIYKNGVATYLNQGTSGMILDIIKHENSIYLAGQISQNETKAVIWKDESPIYLTDGTKYAIANSVAVQGNDIYAAGYEYTSNHPEAIRRAKYWKNGVEVNLTDGNYESEAKKIIVVGNKIYICGYERNAEGFGVAKFWINGVAQSITDGTDEANLIDMAINNENVYTLGQDGSDDIVWLFTNQKFNPGNGVYLKSIFIE